MRAKTLKVLGPFTISLNSNHGQLQLVDGEAEALRGSGNLGPQKAPVVEWEPNPPQSVSLTPTRPLSPTVFSAFLRYEMLP